MHKIRLNSIQYKFWVDHQLKYPSSEFNDSNYTFEITGALCIETLKKAYAQILLEYPPFSSFVKRGEDGYPYFVQDKSLRLFPFYWRDLSSSTLEEIDAEIREFLQKTFDLENEYPCRFLVIRHNEKWFLVYLFHHIAIDAMSLGLFFNRLSEIYNQLLDHQELFREQTQSLLEYNLLFEKNYDSNKEEDAAYWRNYIDGVPFQLTIPQVITEENKGVSYPFVLGNEIKKKAVQFCEDQDTTLFRLYASVWALTLSKVIGADDLLLDHAVNMRPRNDKSLLGVFVNNYPMKFIFSNEEQNFVDVIHHVNKDRAEERKHKHVFYSDFINGDINGINVGINYPLDCKQMRLGLRNCVSMPYESMGHIDLEISADLVLVIETDDALSCYIRYRSNISSDLVESLSTAFRIIIEQVLKNPFVKLKDLILISEEKQVGLLKLENKNLKDIKVTETFLDHFDRVVARYPDYIAVKYEGNAVSYQELDKRSSQVAMALTNQGLMHQRVGLSTPKNIEMLIGILGILKSGNTYVPLDYNYPSERLSFMIKDSKVVLVLVTKETPVSFDGSVKLYIDEISREEVQSFYKRGNISPETIAYIIYTSGTTGRPKGIPISHLGMNQTLVTNVEIQHLDVNSRVMQFANICFDASIVEIFPVLTVGGMLVLPRDEVRKDSRLLLSFLEEQQISSLNIPPVLLSNLPHKQLSDLKTIVIGGDTTSPEAIRFWSKGRTFINAYGPTENTVDATYSLVTPESPINDIGISMQGVTCYVVDRNMHLVPDYTIGELCIGGIKLTDGYIDRPELNKVKFIPNPFVSECDARRGVNLRLYKTGDLVMRRKDGHLIFCGRSDFQVKLHGYRIELGDIEFQIRSFGAIVKNTIVTVFGASADKKLVAYIQVEKPELFDLKKLKDHLSAALPIYMIPAKFIVLKDFPYNSSGKVDRKKLPDPTFFQEEKRSIVEPETPTERKLVDLWTIFLSTNQIGRDDDFLSLGGDSMGVIQLSFKIEESFDITIRASDIYKYSTLRTLAEFIDSHLSAKNQENQLKEENVDEKKHSLSPVQFALWLQCAQSDSIKDAYNLPCIFRCPDNMQFEKLEEAFNHLVRLQESFRMTFPLDKEGRPYIHISEYSYIGIEQIYIKPEELKQVFRQGMKASFDLEHGPLFHCVLYHVEGGACYCSIIMHHLISDGWSANQIKTVLLNSLTGKDVKWEDFSETYTSYVNDVNRFMMTKAYSHRLDYWNEQLKDVSDLKIVKPKRGQENDPSGSCYVCPFPEGLQEEVNTFCYNQIYTPFGFYVSIYLLLLAKISKQSNFGVGFPFLGRERGNYNHVMGYFVHTLPVLYKEEYNDYSFLNYIAAIHQDLLDARENSVSLDELVKIARRESGDSNLGLIQTMFAYEDKELFHDLISHEQSSFGLSLVVLNDEANCSCCIEYQHSCFSEEEAKALVEAFFSLLKSVMADGELPLKKHSLASEAYCKEVIESNVCWTKVNQPVALPFIDKFCEVVKETPEQVAIRYNDESISYRELDRLSEVVAQNIRKANVVSPASIAVNMDASIDAITTILGILKSGCCYIPIAEDLPEERRDFILRDATCSMLFNKENFPQGECLDIDKEAAFDFTDCAYVIYTSGTTGQPKGVPVRQEALAHLVDVERTKFGLSTTSRVLLFSSISFDASVTEIFTTMAVGATLVIAAPEQRKDVQQLTNLLLQESVTCATIPPALLPLLPRVEYPDLATLIVGGESASPSILKHWAKGRRVINAYGPTENTVDTTMCVIGENFEPDDIGLPLPGVTCYVLDEELNIVPAGMEGELYIGGVQLTGGYLNRPDLNKEQFIVNPFVLAEDEVHGFNTKLYRSGDVVIRRHDGHLIFRGRKDRQVKFHGFRIELSEIEKHLLQFDHVIQAFVEIRENHSKEELVAYIQSDCSVDVLGLQRELRYKLPTYMVPAKWAVLDKFPLTVNGKIDKKFLPEPTLIVEGRIDLPETEEEKLLLNLVQDFLGLDAIGVETDLIDMGMTSMQMMEFVVYVSEHSTLNLTISSIYKNRTIRKITKDCDRKLYFWANEYMKEKPLLVFVCGFPYFHPFYDDLIAYFRDKFSIFVMESYNEFFHNKETVTIDILLNYYMEVTNSELKGKTIYAVSGYCVGAEIAMRFASVLSRAGIAEPKVLMLEGFLERAKEKDIPKRDTVNDLINEQDRITTKLFNSYAPIDYDNNIIIIGLAGKTSNRIWLDGAEETDKDLLKQAHEGFYENIKLWQEAYPNAPFYLLDADHWTFFEKQNLDVLWEAMKTHWGI